MENEIIDELLAEFYIAYHNDNYAEGVVLLNDILSKENEESFCIYSRLSSCYYELLDYSKALFYARKAYKLEPESPLVLWDYAGPLIMLKQEKKAIGLLKKIQRMSDDLRDHGFPEPETEWMIGLKNDANFLIGKAYYTICEDKQAKKFLLAYLTNKEKDIKSIYTDQQALSYLEKINNSEDRC